MASRKQIAANRRNALRSTGPRTPEGKSVSRFNALKTGIEARAQVLPDESADDLAALTREYYDRFRPATPEARALVDTLVSSEWQLRRLRRAEPVLWAYAAECCRNYEPDPDEPVSNEIGRILEERAEVFARLQRRIDSAERNYARALKELRRLPRESEPAVDSAEVPEPERVASPTNEIGFVPQIHEPEPVPVGQVANLRPVASRPAAPTTAKRPPIGFAGSVGQAA